MIGGNGSVLFPSGYLRYSFKMHASYDQTIPCSIDYSNITKIVFEKVTPTDPIDAEWHMTIHTGAIASIEEVEQIGSAVSDTILGIVALALNIKISAVRVIGKGLTPRAGEGGIAHLLLPPLQASGAISSGGYPISSGDIQKIQDILTRIPSLKKKSIIRLFRDGVSSEEPLVQFLILYLILEILYDDGKQVQMKIDKFIMSVDPTTPQTKDPRRKGKSRGNLETIYTRLRNEIAHRESFNLGITTTEIRNNLDAFRRIVNRAVSGHI